MKGSGNMSEEPKPLDPPSLQGRARWPRGSVSRFDSKNTRMFDAATPRCVYEAILRSGEDPQRFIAPTSGIAMGLPTPNKETIDYPWCFASSGGTPSGSAERNRHSTPRRALATLVGSQETALYTTRPVNTAISVSSSLAACATCVVRTSSPVRSYSASAHISPTRHRSHSNPVGYRAQVATATRASVAIAHTPCSFLTATAERPQATEHTTGGNATGVSVSASPTACATCPVRTSSPVRSFSPVAAISSVSHRSQSNPAASRPQAATATHAPLPVHGLRTGVAKPTVNQIMWFAPQPVQSPRVPTYSAEVSGMHPHVAQVRQTASPIRARYIPATNGMPPVCLHVAPSLASRSTSAPMVQFLTGSANVAAQSEDRQSIVNGIPLPCHPSREALSRSPTGVLGLEGIDTIVTDTPSASLPCHETASGSATAVVRSEYRESILQDIPAPNPPNHEATSGSAIGAVRPENRENVLQESSSPSPPSHEALSCSATGVVRSEDKEANAHDAPPSPPSHKAVSGSATGVIISEDREIIVNDIESAGPLCHEPISGRSPGPPSHDVSKMTTLSPSSATISPIRSDYKASVIKETMTDFSSDDEKEYEKKSEREALGSQDGGSVVASMQELLIDAAILPYNHNLSANTDIDDKDGEDIPRSLVTTSADGVSCVVSAEEDEMHGQDTELNDDAPLEALVTASVQGSYRLVTRELRQSGNVYHDSITMQGSRTAADVARPRHEDLLGLPCLHSDGTGVPKSPARVERKYDSIDMKISEQDLEPCSPGMEELPHQGSVDTLHDNVVCQGSWGSAADKQDSDVANLVAENLNRSQDKRKSLCMGGCLSFLKQLRSNTYL